MKNTITLLFLIYLTFCISLLGSTIVRAEETTLKEPLGENIDFTLGLQSGYMKGNTTYRITFSGGASELEFPLNSRLIGINMGLTLTKPGADKSNQARLTLSWFTNTGGKSGKMKDSDWLEDDVGYINWYYDSQDGVIDGTPTPPFTPWNNPGKDIYSESDAKLDVDMIDLTYIWDLYFHPDITLGAMLGYKYHKFSYDIKNVQQVGYGPYGPGFFDQTASVSGRVLEYEVTYKFNYLGLNADFRLGEDSRLNLQAGYSGAVAAKDVDDHVLRYKRSKGSCNGDVFLANINVYGELSDHWSFKISGAYVDINTKGTQKQSFYAGDFEGENYIVDDEITASFWTVFISINYGF